MVFSSLTFLYYFLPMLLVLYFSVPSRTFKNALLIVASLFFYGWGEPIWISLMLISSVVDYVSGQIIHRNFTNKWRYFGLLMSLAINLGLLGFFKYYGFLVENINFLFSMNLPYKSLALPIGISFYTFQTLSYTIDMFRGQAKVQNSFPKFLLFVSLFPQLVAGPIVRYIDIADEIDNRKESFSLFNQGVSRFCIGLAKKVVIANTAGQLSGVYLNGSFDALSVVGAWTGILLYAFQIYFDFSGYSDMAIGLGKMFGFHFKENFNYPYVSKSVSEFWRRWHMSLGSFFRDYVYIPLGGNRNHHFRNIFVVWFLTGLWHGASWNFILWGLYYGVLIFLERRFLDRVFEKMPSVIRHLYLIVIVLVGWVFFYFTDMNQIGSYLRIMFALSGAPFIDAITSINIKSNLVFIIFAGVFSTPLFTELLRKLTKDRLAFSFRPLFDIVCLVLSTILLVGQSYNPFLYFRF
ncbi:MAG TPA: membrane-bound O-acyltransferase family protein [Clostridiales bacterium UBA8960]|jgi:alginate O-acetyltransferase complex protein AlgI|nr:membrane-bound O-acyltransferase family protein [Clostridiales bacterium UBA8960]